MPSTAFRAPRPLASTAWKSCAPTCSRTRSCSAETWPQADLQHLRTLRRNALKEREQNKPPRAFRELFRVLRELDEDARAAQAGEQDVAGEEE
jgi:hypothetical protein